MDDQTPVDSLGYGIFVRSAILSIVAQALKQAELHGLPGDHHFYITFATQVEGVVIPDSLRDRHPDQMTIVIQHQYWDLRVEEAGFQVGLSFDGKPQTLSIPFQSIVSFADPSVHFGLSVPAPALYEGGSGMRTPDMNAPDMNASRMNTTSQADTKSVEQPALFVLSDEMPPRQGKAPTPLTRASGEREDKKKPGPRKSSKPLTHPTVAHPAVSAASDQKPGKRAKADKAAKEKPDKKETPNTAQKGPNTAQKGPSNAQKGPSNAQKGNVLRMDQFRKK